MDRVNYLCNKYNISTIKGHRELKSTSCPGLNFPLMEVRQQVLGLKNKI
ncbi:peptidoglycan recognition protein family protein [Tepidibacter formicigenes]|jgi:hypothetical protein|nr:N-acetylmuramoyl-L-alanine amidase [Tepidibacter formicigenes]